MEIVHFEETPLMSIYLLAIFVGDFVTKKYSSKVTVYTHKDLLDQIEFGYTEAPKYLKSMEDFTGIPYELPKLDIVAIPDYLGSMEYWGMNIFT